LQDNRSFGWFAWFSKPLCWLLHVLYRLTFQISYGIPIILLTVIVRSLMIPISRKAALNAQMMQHLQPEIKAIAERYKDDMEKRAQAQRDLFRKYNYNPFGGCFMMFLQLPIFIGLYRGLSVDIALRDQSLIPGLPWCSNLAAPDQLLYWENWMPAFLGSETGWLGPYLNILPVITMVIFLMQQKLFMPPPTDDQQKLVQRMMSFMMIFMGVLFFKVPSGLCLYFITSSVWGMVERKMLPKPQLDQTKLGLRSGTGALSPAQDNQSLEAAQLLTNRAEIESRKRLDRQRQRKLKQRGT
jgi:YidC/Oxa1 family membrane protein insertase